MNNSSGHTVTKLLDRLQEGEREAHGDLYDQVYTELRQRAHQQRRRWKGDPTLQTTALVHEAYLKLVDQEEQSWENRSHFLAVAAQAMRHILIDRARRKRAEKRGGTGSPLSLEELKEKLGREAAMTEEEAEAFVVLDEALDRLEEERPRAARGVECRFFSGMTIEETAEALGVSTATVSRDWKQAKAWLYREMKRIRQGDAGASGDPEEGENEGEA
ncbi:MAG: ECF-type sigma factor [Salinibacter sp.]|uniref:ECF-type sigma factor n=1 Tax=Salinibacter sp. TaxID=2065818 RepID=UPI0035D48C72